MSRKSFRNNGFTTKPKSMRIIYMAEQMTSTIQQRTTKELIIDISSAVRLSKLFFAINTGTVITQANTPKNLSCKCSNCYLLEDQACQSCSPQAAMQQVQLAKLRKWVHSASWHCCHHRRQSLTLCRQACLYQGCKKLSREINWNLQIYKKTPDSFCRDGLVRPRKDQ